jgi:hypothetical protein
MKTYARIQDGIVMELIEPFADDAGQEVPIDQRFSPQIVATLAVVPGGAPVAQGDTYNGTSFGPAPAAPAPPIPAQVTMRQARLALLAVGKLGAVDTAIASLSSPERDEAQIEWDYSYTVDRTSAIVSLLGPALGLDEAALDALFSAAAKL